MYSRAIGDWGRLRSTAFPSAGGLHERPELVAEQVAPALDAGLGGAVRAAHDPCDVFLRKSFDVVQDDRGAERLREPPQGGLDGGAQVDVNRRALGVP